jgi:hypothetical protein
LADILDEVEAVVDSLHERLKDTVAPHLPRIAAPNRSLVDISPSVANTVQPTADFI